MNMQFWQMLLPLLQMFSGSGGGGNMQQFMSLFNRSPMMGGNNYSTQVGPMSGQVGGVPQPPQAGSTLGQWQSDPNGMFNSFMSDPKNQSFGGFMSNPNNPLWSALTGIAGMYGNR